MTCRMHSSSSLSVLLLLALSAAACGSTEGAAFEPAPAEAEDGVVGGKLEDRFPAIGYLASDSNKEKKLQGPTCGATLIAPDVAVTAAHCVQGWKDAHFGFGLGNAKKRVQALFPATSVFYPADYAYDPWEEEKVRLVHDVAILKLASPVPDVTPMKIVDTVAVDDTLLYVGYGRTTTDSNFFTKEGFSKQRKSAQMKLTNIRPANFFTTGIDGGLCYGDSGGPLMGTGKDEIVGVLSDLNKVYDCQPKNEMIFTRLKSERKFIDSAIKCPKKGFVGKLPEACNAP